MSNRSDDELTRDLNALVSMERSINQEETQDALERLERSINQTETQDDGSTSEQEQRDTEAFNELRVQMFEMFGTQKSTEDGRYCWVCFATDEDDKMAAWVQPCKCSGTTKWVSRLFRFVLFCFVTIDRLHFSDSFKLHELCIMIEL